MNVNKSLIKNFDDVKDVIGSRSSQIIDTRRGKHFMGEVEEPTTHTLRALQATGQPLPKRMIRGHIPGAKNLPYELIICPDTGLMHTPEELKERMSDVFCHSVFLILLQFLRDTESS